MTIPIWALLVAAILVVAFVVWWRKTDAGRDDGWGLVSFIVLLCTLAALGMVGAFYLGRAFP